MLWILGLLALVAGAALIASVLIAASKADDRLDLPAPTPRPISLSFSAEEKVRIVLEALREPIPVSVICAREGIAPSVYQSWVKEFIDGGKARLMGDGFSEAAQTGMKEMAPA